jgi:cation diffusion facilitator family transporter
MELPTELTVRCVVTRVNPIRVGCLVLSNQPSMRDRSHSLRQVVAVAFSINVSVAAAKVLYGELTGSAGMSADGLHSGLDALASVIALIGITLATRPPDPSHPYGYERYESLASLVIGGFLVLALARILSQAVARILDPVAVQVTWVSFLVMGLSMLASGGLSWWERRRGQALGSELLGADAAHTGSDVLVSASVIAGLAASALGFFLVDVVVAIGVAGVIGWAAWHILRSAARILTDTSLIDTDLIVALVQGVPGVQDCHAVRARGPTGRARVDLHIHVDPAMRVDQAHEVAEKVTRVIRGRVPEVMEVLVHVGPSGLHEEPAHWVSPSK